LKNSVFKKEKKQKKSEIDDTKLSSSESQSIADAILTGDYSKVKPQNQIPIATFFSYCDQFLRPMTEDDIKFLQEVRISLKHHLLNTYIYIYFNEYILIIYLLLILL